MKKLAVLSILAMTLAIAPAAYAIDVLLAHSYGSPHDVLAADLLAHADIDTVDQWDILASTPTLTDLQAYDAVFVETNYGGFDQAGVGDALGDYVAAGGAVVVTEGAGMASSSSWALAGSIRAYLPLTGGTTQFSSASLGTFDADHPIMDGVSTATALYWGQGVTLADFAYLVASWASSQKFVAVNSRVVSINCNGYDSYDAGTALIFGNALVWASSADPAPTLTSIDPATALVDATPDVDLVGDYFVDGSTAVKLVGPTKAEIECTDVTFTDAQNISCSLDLTGAGAGLYDVVVSTLNGAATLEEGFEVTEAADDDTVADDTAADDTAADDTATDDTAADDTAADDTDDDAADDATDDTDDDLDDTDDDTTTPVGGDDDDDDDGGCCG